MRASTNTCRWPLIVLALLFALPANGHAQERTDETGRHVEAEMPFRSYSAADGLPSDFITALAQSRDGLLWVGTAAGLTTYDAEHFRAIAFPDSIGQADVRSIVAAADSSVWASLKGIGLVQLRDGRTLQWLHASSGLNLRRLLLHNGALHTVNDQHADTWWWSFQPTTGHGTKHPLRFPDSVPGDMRRSITDVAIGPDGQRCSWTRHCGPGLDLR